MEVVLLFGSVEVVLLFGYVQAVLLGRPSCHTLPGLTQPPRLFHQFAKRMVIFDEGAHSTVVICRSDVQIAHVMA